MVYQSKVNKTTNFVDLHPNNIWMAVDKQKEDLIIDQKMEEDDDEET